MMEFLKVPLWNFSPKPFCLIENVPQLSDRVHVHLAVCGYTLPKFLFGCSIALSHTPIMVALCFNSIWVLFQKLKLPLIAHCFNLCTLFPLIPIEVPPLCIALLHWLFSVLTIYLLLPPVTTTGCSLFNLFADCSLPPLPST